MVVGVKHHIVAVGVVAGAALASLCAGVSLQQMHPVYDGMTSSSETASGGTLPKPRILLVTLSCPADKLPMDMMIGHWLRMLHSNYSDISDVVVLDSRPPWNDTSSVQEEALLTLQRTGRARVRRLDFVAFDDSGFVQRFFNITPRPQLFGPSAAAETVTNLTMRSHMEGGYGHMFGDRDPSKTKIALNFFGMLNFLDECLRATDIDICMYLDADMFLHRSDKSDRGLADLAVDAFAKNPDFVQVLPPTVCDWKGNRLPGSCLNKTAPQGASETTLTSRNMILNRRNLKAVLPVQVYDGMFLHYFEEAWTAGVFKRAAALCAQEGFAPPNDLGCTRNRLSGKLNCRGETFVIHPPDAKDGHLEHLLAEIGASVEAWGDNNGAGLAHMSAADATAAVGAFSRTTIVGAKGLIQRMEVGKFMPTDHWGCLNMGFKKERVRRGMAW